MAALGPNGRCVPSLFIERHGVGERGLRVGARRCRACREGPEQNGAPRTPTGTANIDSLWFLSLSHFFVVQITLACVHASLHCHVAVSVSISSH